MKRLLFLVAVLTILSCASTKKDFFSGRVEGKYTFNPSPVFDVCAKVVGWDWSMYDKSYTRDHVQCVCLMNSEIKILPFGAKIFVAVKSEFCE